MEYQKPIFDISIDEAMHLGVDQIAFVQDPAIAELWVAMANEITKLYLSEDKMIVTGPALVPDKLIYRVHPKTGEEYYIRFSEETIQAIVQRYFTQNKQINFNLEHNKENDVQGVILESWIVSDPTYDKSATMAFKNLKKGTWMISVKVEDQQFWNDYVKTGQVKGFSIEGAFAQSLVEAMSEAKDELPSIEEQLSQFTLTPEEAELLIKQVLMARESYSDYPQEATNAAKRALKYKEENPGNTCGTRVGWARANQLASRRPISEETIARMASFARHLQYEDVEYSEGCGGLMVDAWGGRVGIAWAQRKLRQIRREINR
jgi:hypothetical protein